MEDDSLLDICWVCGSNRCFELSCQWPDEEVIEEFIGQLNTDPDGELTLELIREWYW